METITINNIKRPRAEIVDFLVVRDGLVCKHPDCGEALDLNATGSKEVTIDHREPVSWCRANGWTEEQIWDYSNLDLMHKRCNARKSDTRYLEDGTLPTRKSTFKFRREAKAQRPEICTSCSAGRDLDYGEVCAACGSGPMPERLPMWAKVRFSECDHELFWCWACCITPEMRPAAVDIALLQGESGEWDDPII